MTRGSQRELDELVKQTVPLPLGEYGIDLRRPSNPGVLVDLLNAQFKDARTIRRRDGHIRRIIQDSSAFTNEYATSRQWCYGHGTVINPAGNPAQEDIHHPISVKGMGIFEFEGSEVQWTGDRLVIEHDDITGLGSHTFWSRGTDTKLAYGIPAYLPVQTDVVPPVMADGAHMDACYTDKLMCVGYASGVDGGYFVVVDRVSGNVINRSAFGTGEVLSVRVVNSGGKLLGFWVDGGGLQVSRWSGTAWGTLSVIEADATTFDVVPLSGGCQVIWNDALGISAGRFSEQDSVDAPHPFGTQLFVDSFTPAATGCKVGIDVAPNGDIVYVWVASDGTLRGFSDTGTLSVELDQVTQFGTGTDWDHGNSTVTVTYRGLANEDGRYSYVVHGTTNGVKDTYIWEQDQAVVALANPPFQDHVVYNSELLSKGFRVGDEVFAWLRADNSSTTFLIAGVTTPQVVGISEREITDIRRDSNVEATLRSVTPDPNEEFGYMWIRPYEAGEYFRKGDTLIGNINFMPRLSTALYGRSLYVAGSHVRCWDGQELGDAGFHDYAAFGTITPVDGAGTVDDGEHFIRVYPVRYNHKGERFQGVGQTSAGVTVAGAQDTITVEIRTTPVTNHDDVQWEIYMTPVGSTVFRYAGVIANDLSVKTITATITSSDVQLEAAPADPHAPGVDGLQELEEFGPLGCEVLHTSGDRLWGIRGQVPTGVAQFSKLYEVNEGVGFGDLVSTHIVDATGKALTAITSFSDSAVIAFQESRFYELLGSGPDNFGQGSYGTPQLKVADGAINQQGVIAMPSGIAFWSPRGPRLLAGNLTVINIAEPVEPLARTLTPTGVRCDISLNEVVWYTEGGNALLWSFEGGNSRWARWTGVAAAGVSETRIMTPYGESWEPSSSTLRDGGKRFTFLWETGNIRSEQLLQGGNRIFQVGFTGKYLSEHNVKFRVYYDGSPSWLDSFKWNPGDSSWLNPGTDYENLTAAEIDALNVVDRTGRYDVMTRVSRQDCDYIRVMVSDCGDGGFIPWEMTYEIASKGGPGRQAAKSIVRNGG